jgi:hypothetical protein
MLDYFKPTDDGNFVFDATGGGDPSTVLLPYIEQHGESDDGGIVIDWTTGNGPKGGDTVGVIAIITPAEHGGRDGSNQGIVINWTSGEGSSHDAFPTETMFPTETIHSMESVHALHDLVV